MSDAARPRVRFAERLLVTNHRGRRVPAVLGLWLAAFGAVSTAATIATGDVGVVGASAAGACLVVAAAGLVDDLSTGGPRGVRGHLAALARGIVSTGIVKLAVVTGAALVAVAFVPARTVVGRVAGVVLVAGSANLVNGLDVRPGRAIKFALPALLLAIGAIEWPTHPALPGIALGALVLLPWDAGERAMLGDAGSNLLGFAIGLAAFDATHGLALVAAAAAVVVLNALAETVTLSRLIDLVPPLRWYDRLGRVDPPGDHA